jgi:hypothetical protein
MMRKKTAEAKREDEQANGYDEDDVIESDSDTDDEREHAAKVQRQQR